MAERRILISLPHGPEKIITNADKLLPKFEIVTATVSKERPIRIQELTSLKNHSPASLGGAEESITGRVSALCDSIIDAIQSFRRRRRLFVHKASETVLVGRRVVVVHFAY
jgi:hypothetical protein